MCFHCVLIRAGNNENGSDGNISRKKNPDLLQLQCSFEMSSAIKCICQEHLDKKCGNHENSVSLGKCLFPVQVPEFVKMYVFGEHQLDFRSYNWHELLQVNIQNVLVSLQCLFISITH